MYYDAIIAISITIQYISQEKCGQCGNDRLIAIDIAFPRQMFYTDLAIEVNSTVRRKSKHTGRHLYHVKS